jgi:hypothetical protein
MPIIPNASRLFRKKGEITVYKTGLKIVELFPLHWIMPRIPNALRLFRKKGEITIYKTGLKFVEPLPHQWIMPIISEINCLKKH